jgi:hypothetical protein
VSALDPTRTSGPWSAFEALGDALGRRWHAAAHDARAFPALAAAALAEARLSERIDFEALTRALLARERLPTQTSLGEDFGEPPVCVYAGESFYIEVLFWLDGLVAIHQHSFSGAFMVLHGSSLETTYRFHEERRVNAATRVGRLEPRDAELLERGAIRPIHAGAELIHATFHLDTPTVSVVVRTHHDAEAGPQLNYQRPGLASDPFHQRAFATKRMQLLRMLQRCGSPSFEAQLEEVLAGADLPLALALVQALDEPGTERVLAAARRVHGAAVEILVPVLAEAARKRTLTALRRRTTDPELRFFLALLLNVARGSDVLRLVAARYPGPDPRDTVVGWVRRLALVDDEGWHALLRVLLDGEREPRHIRARLGDHARRYPTDFALAAEILALRALAPFQDLLGDGG